MSGIIAGAIGGLGAGMQQVAQNLNASAMQDQQFSNAASLEQMRAGLALDKEKALEQFRAQLGTDTANQARTAMLDRINEAKGGIINGALAGKYAQSDAAVADADAGNTDAPLTDDQKAAIAQAKGIDAARLASDPNIETQAAIATGDIDPKTAATLTNKTELQQMKTESYLQSVQAKLEAARDRTDMMGMIAQMRVEAAQGKADGKLPSDAKMIDYLVQNGMDRKTATDRVTGTGAGATKDPVAMAASLASAMINNGAVKVTKDDPAGTTVMSKAMMLATGEIQKAEANFGRGGSVTPTVAPPAIPAQPGTPTKTAPRTDPLGLFKH